MTAPTGPGGPGLETAELHRSQEAMAGTVDVGQEPEVVLHEERLLVSTERVATERVRITKRIVATTRTIEVPVRLEQLVITHEPLDGSEAPTGAAGEDVVIVLHEEVPEVSLRVVATERVVVSKRAVAGEQIISVDVHSEVADVTTLDVTP